MRVRDEKLIDEILVLHARRRAAPPAATLCVVIGNGLRLGVAGVRQRDHEGFLGDQVFDGEVAVVFDDLGPALVRVGSTHFLELRANHRLQLVGVR